MYYRFYERFNAVLCFYSKHNYEKWSGEQYTVLLRNNLTENAFETRPERVRKCVPFAFHSRSICVPKRSNLRSTFTGTHPGTLVIRSNIIGKYRDCWRSNPRKAILILILCFFNTVNVSIPKLTVINHITFVCLLDSSWFRTVMII